MGFGQISGANGGVYMRFKRSIKPFESFSLRTRCIGWDEKWLLVEHRFFCGERVKAAGICKVAVFQNSNIVRPSDALRKLGYRAPDLVGAGSLEGLLSSEKYFGKEYPGILGLKQTR